MSTEHLTKENINKAIYIKQLWELYEPTINSAALPPIAVKLQKSAFYSGFVASMKVYKQIMDEPALSDKERLVRIEVAMEAHADELVSYVMEKN